MFYTVVVIVSLIDLSVDWLIDWLSHIKWFATSLVVVSRDISSLVHVLLRDETSFFSCCYVRTLSGGTHKDLISIFCHEQMDT